MQRADMNVSRILERRSRWLALPETWDRAGQVLEREELHEYCALLAQHSGERYSTEQTAAAMRLSLLNRVGTVWDAETLRDDLLRLAANLSTLSRGIPVPPWNGPGSEPELVPTQLMDCRGERLRDVPGVRFRIRLLGGTPCGMTVHQWWSIRFCHVLARRIGFTSRRGSRPLRSPWEMVGMRIAAVLSTDREQREPALGTIIEPQPSGLRAWNRALWRLRQRARPGGIDCPLQLPPALPCWRCPAGRDRCPVAVRRVSYEQRLCRRCSGEQWHDPGQPYCIHCMEKAAWAFNST